MNAREKMVRNVLDQETIEFELTTVAKMTEGQGKLMKFTISV